MHQSSCARTVRSISSLSDNYSNSSTGRISTHPILKRRVVSIRFISNFETMCAWLNTCLGGRNFVGLFHTTTSRQSLVPDGEKCSAETRGLLRRIPIKGGLHHPIGKETSRFEQGQDDFIENIDDAFIRCDGGRVAANESLKAEIRKLGLRKTTKETGLDRKTIRAVLSGKKVKVSTLAKVVNGLQSQWKRPTGSRSPGSRKAPK